LYLGNCDTAIDNFNKAIEFTPEDVYIFEATMQSLISQDDNFDGTNILKSLIMEESYADLSYVYAYRATAYFQKGNPKKASEDLDKAVRLGLDPDLAEQIRSYINILELMPKAGYWKGSSDSVNPLADITFKIGMDGQILDFTLVVFLKDLSYCQFVSQEESVWVDNTFYFYLDTPSYKDGIFFEGVFDSTTSVHGTFNGYFECITSSGDYYNGGMIQNGSWHGMWIRDLEEPLFEGKNSG
jgi:tetratricopeptide (TPR) repeat protein